MHWFRCHGLDMKTLLHIPFKTGLKRISSILVTLRSQTGL
uniref:Uncharacterized protein n=1 Tax=Anguilla anguilla TaxID=7936 RepID=A0A0E9SHC3_ANGAN